MNFIMDERKYAENILAGSGFGDNYRYTAGILAKFYKADGCDNRLIRAELKRIMAQRIPGVFEKSGDKIIKKALETAEKSPLCIIPEIKVTDNEIELIKTIHSEKFKDCRLQRLAFALLCFAKFSKARGIKDYWVNTEWKYIFAAADLRGLTVDKQCLFIHELYISGYIGLNVKIESHGIKVLGVRDGETAVVVNDINEVGFVFEEYCGKNFVRCQRCGKMIPVTNGHRISCPKCAADINREKTKERMRKLRCFSQV